MLLSVRAPSHVENVRMQISDRWLSEISYPAVSCPDLFYKEQTKVDYGKINVLTYLFGQSCSGKQKQRRKHILLLCLIRRCFEKTALQYLLVQSAQLHQLLDICIMRFALAIMLCRISSDYSALRNKLSEICID